MLVVFQISGGVLCVKHSDAPITVACRGLGDGEFEPLYGIDENQQRVPLPSCFQLNDAALHALRGFTQEVH